jgi:hypothetical protein
MSGQVPTKDEFKAYLERMKALLTANDFSYTIWQAYFELYKRDMINYQFMEDSLTHDYSMLDNPDIFNLHHGIISASNAIDLIAVSNKAVYLKLLTAIKIVFREEPGQETSMEGEAMFDMMLQKHKEVIEKLQMDRQTSAAAGVTDVDGFSF